jgi:hypothetical protein
MCGPAGTGKKTNYGATTLIIMTFSITILSIMTLSITINNETQHFDTWHSILLCRVSFKLSVVYAECHKQTHYAECRCAECLGAIISFYILQT